MLKRDTLSQRVPTLDRAKYGNVSMTRLVSSPVCPAIWPFIIRAAVTVGTPIPGKHVETQQSLKKQAQGQHCSLWNSKASE